MTRLLIADSLPRVRRRVLLAALVVLATLTATPGRGAAEGGLEIQGGVPAGGGIVAAFYGGGTTDALRLDATSLGCQAASAWIFAGGQPVGFRFGSPAFVNASFLARYPGGVIEPNTILILRCGATSAPTVSLDQWVPIGPVTITVTNTGDRLIPGTDGVVGWKFCTDAPGSAWTGTYNNGIRLTIIGRGIGACDGWYRVERLVPPGIPWDAWFWIRAEKTDVFAQ